MHLVALLPTLFSACMETITRKRGIPTVPGAVAGRVSQVGHLGQHRLWTPEGLADETIGASQFLVIVSRPGGWS